MKQECQSVTSVKMSFGKNSLAVSSAAEVLFHSNEEEAGFEKKNELCVLHLARVSKETKSFFSKKVNILFLTFCRSRKKQEAITLSFSHKAFFFLPLNLLYSAISFNSTL